MRVAALDGIRAFGVHVEETRNQVKRLDQVFKLVGEKPEGVECKAIQGIVAEGEEVMSEFGGSEAIDAGPNERPLTKVTLSRYYISKFPITNAEYEQFDSTHARITV